MADQFPFAPIVPVSATEENFSQHGMETAMASLFVRDQPRQLTIDVANARIGHLRTYVTMTFARFTYVELGRRATVEVVSIPLLRKELCVRPEAVKFDYDKAEVAMTVPDVYLASWVTGGVFRIFDLQLVFSIQYSMGQQSPAFANGLVGRHFDRHGWMMEVPLFDPIFAPVREARSELHKVVIR